MCIKYTFVFDTIKLYVYRMKPTNVRLFILHDSILYNYTDKEYTYIHYNIFETVCAFTARYIKQRACYFGIPFILTFQQNTY